MKNILNFLLIAVFTALAATSCKKANNPTDAEKIIGNWQMSVAYTDSNKNGAIDSGERVIETFTSPNTFAFTADHKCDQWGKGFAEIFNWDLVNDNKYLRLTPSSPYFPNGYYILKLESNEMVLVDTATTHNRTGVTWLFYRKK